MELVLLVGLLCTVLPVVNGVDFDPEPDKWIQGQYGSFSCSNPISVNVKKNGNQEATCTTDGNNFCLTPAPSYATVTVTGNTLSFTILNVDRARDTANWGCSGTTTNIDVKIPVPSATIENKNSLTFTDGQITSITCKTGVSNPPATITWSIGGTNINGGTTTNNPDGTTTSIYPYTPDKTDHNKILQCSATNGFGSPKTESLTLIITCEDRFGVGFGVGVGVGVGVSIVIAGVIVGVTLVILKIKGRTIALPLTSTKDTGSDPGPQFTNITSSAVSGTTTSGVDEPSHYEGEEGTGPIRQQKMKGTISTKSPSILNLFIYLFIISFWINTTDAQPRIISSGRTVEGTTDYFMSCTIITVDPLRSITWERLGAVDVTIDAVEQQRSVAGLIETKATITLAITRADDEQQFRCTTVQSNNVVQTAIEMLFVDVIPTPPVIQGPESISENKTGVYTCTSSGGRPASSIRWRWSNGQGLYNDNVSTVINADNTFNTISDLPLLGIAGYNGRILICEVSHYHLNENQTATVPISVVSSVPSVTIVNETSLTFTDGQTTSITCKTGVSNPPATITWSIGGTNINGATTTNNPDGTTTSILQYTPDKTDHNKILQCSATNGFGSPKTESLTLIITCEDRFGVGFGVGFGAGFGACLLIAGVIVGVTLVILKIKGRTIALPLTSTKDTGSANRPQFTNMTSSAVSGTTTSGVDVPSHYEGLNSETRENTAPTYQQLSVYQN